MDAPETRRSLESSRRLSARTAVVVGGGVSGCACAATLAARGVQVTVVNSALDRVGQPAYGPDVSGGAAGLARIREVMAEVPPVLRGAWFRAAVAPVDGAAFFSVDRRMLSIETKRALERIPGVEFRQGLVTDVRMVPADGRRPPGKPGGGERIAVETAFGEVIEADAVVVAVGLSLGGRVAMGEDVVAGGRWGETPAPGLRSALEGLGVKYRETGVMVGPRFSGRILPRGTMTGSLLTGPDGGGCGEEEAGEGDEQGGAGDHGDRGSARRWGVTRAVPLLEVLSGSVDDAMAEDIPEGSGRSGGARSAEGGSLPVKEGVKGALAQDGGASSGAEWSWPVDYPETPYWTEGLRVDDMIVGQMESGETVPMVSPDGVATGEVYVSPKGLGLVGWERSGEDAAAHGGRPVATRLEHAVTGLAVMNLTVGGRLSVGGGGALPVWVAGRAAGAVGYLESLLSGVRVGSDLAGALGGPSRQGSESVATRGETAAGGAAEDPGCAGVDGRWGA